MTEVKLTDNARKIFDMRYSRKDEEGQPTESPEEAVWRVAINVASVNSLYVSPKYHGIEVPLEEFPFRTTLRQARWLTRDPEIQVSNGWYSAKEKADLYEEMIANLDFLPNSPTWTGAGTELGQLAACFVLPIEDDLVTKQGSIYGTLRDAVAIQQTGGGNGFSGGRIRPKDALVKRSMGRASGPLGFARSYNGAFKEMAQGGTRRGANMFVMPIHHPDIEAFIQSKVVEGELDQFNFSVAITDEFMEALDHGDHFDLHHDGKTYKTVLAQDLWDMIIRNAWVIGDPGVLFIDKANAENPCPTRYTLEATNPCVTGDTWVMTSLGPRPIGLIAADGPDALEPNQHPGDPEDVVIDGVPYKARFFETGTKPVFVLSTVEGYRLRLTADHRVMLSSGEWAEAQNLQAGDQIRLHDHGDFEWSDSESAWRSDGPNPNWEDGYLVGAYVGDGNITSGRNVALTVWETDPGYEGVKDEIERAARIVTERSHVKVRSDWKGWHGPYGNGWYTLSNRAVSDAIWAAFSDEAEDLWDGLEWQSSDFYRGFLRGLFDADGHVESGNGSPNVRLTQSNLDLLRMAQRMLLRLGMFSRIYTSKGAGTSLLPDGKGGVKEYEVRESWRLVISGESVQRYARRIGFSNEKKAEGLNILLSGMSRGPYSKPFVATVEALIPDGEEAVYDVAVADEKHAFDANGLYVHNCGEQWLGPYENCCLGSINLGNFASWDGAFDWARFERTVVQATEFLDDVVDANQYVETVPKLEEAAQGGRRIGLGLMGLADAMVKMGLRYGSPDALDFASQVTEYARYHCMRASINRARERGPFPWIEASVYDPNLLGSLGEGGQVTWGHHDAEGNEKVTRFNLWQRPTPIAEHVRGFGRPIINWDFVAERLLRHGIRNCCQFTFAPTGTISNVAGLEGSGCEPMFALVYTRKVMQEEEHVDLHYASPLFHYALMRAWEQGEMNNMGCSMDSPIIGVTNFEEYEAIVIEQVRDNGGSCQGWSVDVPKSVKDIFVVAADVTPTEHVKTQAVLQRFVDNSISKTINMPFEATVDDVSDVYKTAFALGCKGITMYRQGSRQIEVLSTKRKSDEEVVASAVEAGVTADFVVQSINDTAHDMGIWPVVHPMKIPAAAKEIGLPARVFPVETAFGKVQVTVTEHPDFPNRPFDIRMQIGKGGNDKNADVEAIGRLVSIALRSGVAVEDIVEQLEGIGGQTVYGFGERKVKSVADGVAKLLGRMYLGFAAPSVDVKVTETVAVIPIVADPDLICEKCHNATMVVQDGCSHCDIRLGGCGAEGKCL